MVCSTVPCGGQCWCLLLWQRRGQSGGGTTSRIGSEFYDGQADRGGPTGTAVSCLQTTSRSLSNSRWERNDGYLQQGGCTGVIECRDLKERERQEVLRVNKECWNEVKKCVQAGWNGWSVVKRLSARLKEELHETLEGAEIVAVWLRDAGTEEKTSSEGGQWTHQ